MNDIISEERISTEEPDSTEEPKEGEAPQKSPSKYRARVALCLTIACAILFSLSIPALWLNNLITNTDAWVETLAPLAAEPAIQDELATQSAQAIKERVNAVSLAEQALPEELRILAVPVGSMMNSFIDEATDEFIRSPQFYEIWEEMNRFAHSAFTSVVLDDGEEGILSLEEGELSLDLSMLTDAIIEKLEEQGLSFDDFGSGNRNDRQLGRVVLFQSQTLANTQAFISAIPTLTIALTIITLCLAVGAFAASMNRRKTGLQLSLIAFAVLLVTHFSIRIAITPLADSLVPKGDSLREAFFAAYETISSSLLSMQESLMIVAVLAALILYFAGPSRFAVSTRSMFKRLFWKARAALQ